MSVKYDADGNEVCGGCEAPKTEWVQKNHSKTDYDYDYYCGRCGQFIRIAYT